MVSNRTTQRPHRRRREAVCLTALLTALLTACGGPSEPGPDATGASTGSTAGAWPHHANSPWEQRFSALGHIDQANVGTLGLAWSYDTGENRKHESTPLVVDGVMYLTASWSVVHALDARSGERLWVYDPRVRKDYSRYACCGVVNRGVAYRDGYVYVGSLDGRLIKLAADSGEAVWEVDTIGGEVHYTITGAPRIVKDRVIIGNGGAEYGVRGYVSAYDADSGELVWRFWTVPGDPSEPFEHPELADAVKTWNGEWWKIGGGGTVWDSMAYDPELDLLYVGTGNGSPWSRSHRSPGGGDNLFLSSILALDPDDGRLAWHYQTTPGDNWDYTATQHIILADLEIDGQLRKVAMQAPKNGFFYVLDRATGELISAEKYAQATWASHVDKATGRPVETAAANYDETPRVVMPSPGGAHNWEPMAFHPGTGLVYVPTADSAMVYSKAEELEFLPGTWNTGLNFGDPKALALFAQMPRESRYLLAWDPARQEERWRVPLEPGERGGGTLATAGSLVFQGTTDGRLAAYAADSGERLWQTETRVGIIAPPMTYALDGKQYVTVVAGIASQPGKLAGLETVGRVFTFELGGATAMPAVAERATPATPLPEPLGTPAQIGQGAGLYAQHCGRCHGFLAMGGSGAIPDLRFSDPATHQSWNAIVVDGARASRGMASFSDVLSEADAEAIHAFVVQRAIATRQ